GGDQVVVVEDPLRRRGDELAAMDVVGHRAVRLLEEAGVVLQPRITLAGRAPPVGIDGDARGERVAELLEQLDAEQLVAQRPLRLRRRTAEEAAGGDFGACWQVM